jgi:signal peptidase I
MTTRLLPEYELSRESFVDFVVTPRKKEPMAILSQYRKKISPFRWVVSVVLVIVFSGLWAMFLRGNLRSFKVVSGSMEPTLRIGDYVLARTFRDVGELCGRIIAFEDPTPAGEILTKRVVGCPGDRVEIGDGIVRINGRQEFVPWQRTRYSPVREYVIPPGYVFVLGDNRANSVDSIDYGPVPAAKVVGIVFFRYWPPQGWGRVR